MNEQQIWVASQDLLRLFREEQWKRGNHGCLCTNCLQDMDEALTRFVQEAKFHLETIGKTPEI